MAGDLDAALTLLRTNGYKATPPTLRRMATKPRELVIIDRTNLQKPLYRGLIAAKLLEDFESLVFGNAHLLTV